MQLHPHSHHQPRMSCLPAIVTIGSILLLLCAPQPCDASSSSSPHRTAKLTKKYPSSTSTYPTNSLLHLEPVLGYKLRHEDNADLYAAYDANQLTQAKVAKLKNNHARSFAAHSLKSRLKSGLQQPYPNTITVEFYAYGERFYFPQMQLSTHMLTPNSKTTVSTGTSSYDIPNVLQSYHYRDAQLGVDATVTLHENGLFHGLITRRENGSSYETYQIDPVAPYASSMKQADFDALDHAAQHGVAVFKQSASKGAAGSGADIKCGSIQASTAVDGAVTDEPEIHLDTLNTSSSRHLMYAMTGDGVRRWENCYPDEVTGRMISMGIAVDYTMYQRQGSSISNVQSMISTLFSNINRVYIAQFNVYIQVNDIYIKTTDFGAEKWNNSTREYINWKCAQPIIDRLTAFRDWRNTNRSRQNSLWHLMTDCYGPTGTVGMAYLGGVCSSSLSAGLSSWTDPDITWRIVAHEVGHNFAAQHTFQYGQGNTGGIMDYNAYDWPRGTGIIQFNDFNIQDICPFMKSSAWATETVTPFCYQPYAPTCGNGVVDMGEECDDTSSCCQGCRFAPGAVCSAVDYNACCNPATCQYMPSNTGCNSASWPDNFPQGYCRNGKCEQTTCSQYNNAIQCGWYQSNPCQQQCLYEGTCGGPSTYPSIDLNLPDGTLCSQTPVSTCISGQCIAQADQTTLTYHWEQMTPSVCNCTGFQTVSVVCKDGNGLISNSTRCPQDSKPASLLSGCAPGPQCTIWKQLGFGNCSMDCGVGTQTQIVQCVKTIDQSVIVPNEQCQNATKPVTSRSCYLTACPIGWVVSGFGECSKPCDGGIQTQTVQCMQTQNGTKSVVDSKACSKGGSQPPTQQTCNEEKCGTYSWSYGNWTTCASCGGGNRTRSATCVQTNTTVAVPIGNCTVGMAGVLVTQEICNTPACSSSSSSSSSSTAKSGSSSSSSTSTSSSTGKNSGGSSLTGRSTGSSSSSDSSSGTSSSSGGSTISSPSSGSSSSSTSSTSSETIKSGTTTGSSSDTSSTSDSSSTSVPSSSSSDSSTSINVGESSFSSSAGGTTNACVSTVCAAISADASLPSLLIYAVLLLSVFLLTDRS